MSDGNSAEIFGTLFEWLLETPTEERTRVLAVRLAILSQNYDFHPLQMGVDLRKFRSLGPDVVEALGITEELEDIDTLEADGLIEE